MKLPVRAPIYDAILAKCVIISVAPPDLPEGCVIISHENEVDMTSRKKPPRLSPYAMHNTCDRVVLLLTG